MSVSAATPLLTHSRLDIPAGTLVTVETKSDGIFSGNVFQNPKAESGNKVPFVLQLINVTKKGTNEFFRETVNLYEREIIKVVVNEHPLDRSTLKKCNQEVFMDTVIVDNIGSLNNLLAQLSDVEEIGCSFEFGAKSRQKPDENDASLIIFCIKNILIPMDILKISEEIQVKGLPSHSLWKPMETKIFCNGNICKIFYDSRIPAKYLYLSHGIRLQNVFDIRLAEMYLLYQANDSRVLKHKPVSGTFELSNLSLANLLLKYLCHIVPSHDLKLLEASDNHEVSRLKAIELEEEKNKKVFEDTEDDLKLVMDLNGSQKLVASSAIVGAKVASKFKQNCLKTLALRVKYLIYLKSELENKILKPLENLTTANMDFITQSNNATAHGFLSMPEHVGQYFRDMLANTHV